MSNDIAQKLSQLKQYQAKLPPHIITELANDIYSILGGVHSILEHYLSNARYLKLEQINHLHQLLSTKKQQIAKQKRARKRANSSHNNKRDSFIRQSSTALAITPRGEENHDQNASSAYPTAAAKMKHSRSSNEITGKKTNRHKRTKSTTKPIKSKSSLSLTPSNKFSEIAVPTDTATDTNYQGLVAPEYEPLFASKSAETAEIRQNRRDRQRRGSGLEERMKREREKKSKSIHKEQSQTPHIATHVASKSLHLSRENSRIEHIDNDNKAKAQHNLYPKGRLKPRFKMEKKPIQKQTMTISKSTGDLLRDDQSEVSDLSDREEVMNEQEDEDKEAEYDEEEEEKSKVGGYDEMITELTMYDETDNYRLRESKNARRYSISEHTDWDTEDDQLEIQQSNEYFSKLEKKYAKKKKKQKGSKEKKRKKLERLKRMAMQQMQQEKEGKAAKRKRGKSAADVFAEIIDANFQNEDDVADGDELLLLTDEEDEYQTPQESDQDEGDGYDDTENKSTNVPAQKAHHSISTKAKPKKATVTASTAAPTTTTATTTTTTTTATTTTAMDRSKMTMESPEFLAYFEKFMAENSSFYSLQMDDGSNDGSDSNSIQHESNNGVYDDIYKTNIAI